MKRITDKDFKYTPAAATDLRATFARIRRELVAETKRADAQKCEQVFKVRSIGSRR